MAEVGVLSLQIHDNSEKAASGLNRLASALERVRGAVGSGKQLSGAAKEIEKINSAVSGATGGNVSKSLGDIAKKVDAAKQAASGFVDVSSKIEETMSSAGDAMADATKSVNTYTDSIKEAKKAAEATGKTVKDSWSRFNPETGEYDPMPGIKGVSDLIEAEKKAHEASVTIDNIRNQIADMRYGLENPVKINFGDFIKQTMNIEGPVKSAKESMDVFLQAFENMEGMTETEARIAELNPELQDLATNGESSRTVIQRMKEAFFGADSEVSSFGGAVRALLPSLSSMSKQLVSIARRMALRAIIKQVTAGFKEGVENLYWYSKAVGTDFAPAMDSAASAMLQFKNSIGAAAAPVIQAMIPVLQTVVNWFITAINYANQFLALITGRSGWTRALPVAADAFEQTGRRARSAGSSAREAAKDIKELLADWDELNIIQSETGGGTGSGGGGTGGAGGVSAEYASMFEEVNGFNEGIEAFVRNMRSQFGSILGFVEQIGAAVLAWKVSRAFSGIIGKLATLAGAFFTIKLTFDLSEVLTNSYFDTGNPGFLVADLLTTALGATLATRLLKPVLGAGTAELAIPITFIVSAAATIIASIKRTDVDVLSKESLAATVIAALESGTAAAYLFHMAGYELGEALGGGIGLAAVTFGVAVGLKAVAQVAKDGKLTSESIGADFLSAAAIGVGLGLTEVALGGEVLTALTLAGGGALMTLGALIAIQTVVAEVNRSTITWGNYEPTKEEIKAFVEGEIFDGIAPTVNISLLNAKVTELGQSKEGLESQMSDVLGELKVVSLGLKSNSESDLKTKVNDLVKKYNETTAQYQEVLKISVDLVPVTSSAGQDRSEEVVANSETRWAKLNGIMEGLAHDLTAAFDTAYNNDLDDVTRRDAQAAIEKISNMMTEIADAITFGQAKASAVMQINARLSEFSHGAVDALIEEYKAQRDLLIEELTKQSLEGAEGVLAQQYAYEKLMEYALREAGGDTSNKDYQEYKRLAEEAALDYADIINSAAQNAEREADKTLEGMDSVQNIRKALMDKTFADIDLDPEALVASWGVEPEIFSKALANALTGDTETAKTLIEDGIYAMLFDVVGPGSYGTYTQAIDAGMLSLGDFFSKRLIDSIASELGIPDEGPIRENWDNIVKEILKIGEEETSKPIYDVPEIKTDVASDVTVQESVTYETVEEAVDAGKNAVGNLPEGVGQELASTDEVIKEHTFAQTNKVDTSATTDSVHDMATSVMGDLKATANAINSFNSFVGGLGGVRVGGAGRWSGLTGTSMQLRATGGAVRSGEMFFANENGNIEMMGKMGNSAVVANNQQIVEGISKGVAASNSGMESAMNMMVALMRQFVSKEFTARVVPSSGMGRNNVMSGDAYRKVTG